MSWNYRVIKLHSRHTGDYYQIHEVYYDEKGNIKGIATDCSAPIGDSLMELKAGLEMYMNAFSKPVIDLEDYK